MLKKELKKVINQFEGDYKKKVKSDAEKIISLNAHSLDDLITIVLEHRKIENRCIACWFIGQLSFKKAEKVLLDLFKKEKNKSLLWEIGKTFIEINNKDTIDFLMKILKNDSNANRRLVSAYVLGFLKSKESTSVLIEILHNKNEKRKIRGQAAESLGNIGNKTVIPELIKALKYCPTIKYWVIYSLGELKAKKAIPYLEEIIKKDKSIVKDFGAIKDEAIYAIENIE
jgi:HEAT repeat protein